MEDFNPMRKRMLEYRSPLHLEEAWESLELKKENLALQKRVRVRNIALISSIGISCVLLLLWIRNPLSPVQKAVEIEDHTGLTEERGGEDEKSSEVEVEVEVEKYISTSPQTEKQEQKPPQAVEVLEDTYLSLPSGGNDLSYPSTGEELTDSDNPLWIFPMENLPSSHLVENILSARTLGIPLKSLEVEREEILSEKDRLFGEKPMVEKKSEVSKTPLSEKKIQSKQDNSGTTSLIEMPPGGSSAKTAKMGGRKNFVKLELLGQGLLYSVNYGRIIRRREYGDLDFQIGLSLHPGTIDSEGREVLTQVIPISLNQSFRIRANHNLLFGVGASYVNDQVGNAANINSVFAALKAGYRYQKPGRRLFFEGEILFLQTMNPGSETDWLDSILTGGLAIGYRF